MLLQHVAQVCDRCLRERARARVGARARERERERKREREREREREKERERERVNERPTSQCAYGCDGVSVSLKIEKWLQRFRTNAPERDTQKWREKNTEDKVNACVWGGLGGAHTWGGGMHTRTQTNVEGGYLDRSFILLQQNLLRR